MDWGLISAIVSLGVLLIGLPLAGYCTLSVRVNYLQ